MILPEVYRVAEELWPRASSLSLDKLGDAAIGHRLLSKAAANVSRQLLSPHKPIQNLKSYLWLSFRRLALEELKRSQRQHSADDELEMLGVGEEKIDDRILWQEILRQVDPQTRQLFQLRALGHSYEEIARLMGKQANVLRAKLDKEIKKLRKQFNA
jgi:DNA-directed RNA polymerase specialized sigma24 family protein